MPRSRFASFALVALASAACATRPSLPKEADAARPFVIERDLAGKTVGRGVFKSIAGKDRGFTANLDGTWDGERLTLIEDFLFDDGETDRKTWVLTRTGPGTYTGVREDVVGEAKGYMDGAALRLEYRVDFPTDGGGYRRVGFRDVLALQADGAVINRATVGWRGFRVGGVVLTIQRAE